MKRPSVAQHYFRSPTQVHLHFPRYFFHTSPLSSRDEIKSVAVLGGGITGLASAYYLSKWLPKSTTIELFESSSRLGGWIGSSKVNVGTDPVIFEKGPRSLRPGGVSGLVTLDLIAELEIEDQILSTSRDSPSATNRYIYYPDHLVRLPGPGAGIIHNLSTFFREPIFDGVRAGLLSEVNKPARPSDVHDESVGHFISRRFGPELADNVVSAVFHGIYAGDIYRLSARSITPFLWHTEARYGSIMRGLLKQAFSGKSLVSAADVETELDGWRPLDKGRRLRKQMGNVSLYTFRDGLGELVRALSRELYKSPNVVVSKSSFVRNIRMDEEKTAVKIEYKAKQSSASEARQFSHVISTLTSSTLSDCIQNPRVGAQLKLNATVTVMVVNLFFNSVHTLPVQGFGYLLPRSVPFEENPEAALGVIFDTDALPKQDILPGSKLTVILGGHWWDGWEEFPSQQDGLRDAMSILKRHLGITEEPSAVQITLQKNCIPQYLVGHDDHMAQVSRDLEHHFAGKLQVAGSSYTGVGVNDCVRSARDLVRKLIDGTGRTGLDSFAVGRPWTERGRPPRM